MAPNSTARSRSPPVKRKALPKPGDVNPLTGRSYSKSFFQILETRRKLPCWNLRDEAVKMVSSNQASLLIGETGSGKTTQVPQFLFDAGYAKTGAIAVTQPRRVAAMSVSARVAQEMDVELGDDVGYLIRFEDVTSSKTKLKYMTDGMLLRECMTDPTMAAYSCVVLDEAHERTLSTDILFGLLKEVMEKRPELRVLVMSATLEAEKFQEYWSDAPLLRVPGRMYPVETFFTLRPEKDYVQATIEVAVQIHMREGPGDILIFLCGEEEIETACMEISDRCQEDNLWVFPLYSSLPMSQQREVFPPAPEGVRKVIVATNIAETSLTIDGVVYVIDPGLAKQKLYNPRTHAESLLVSPISRANAMQRAGRAGRTRPGKCFRLYTQDTFGSELPQSQYPEIVRSNLCSVVLTLKKLGVDDIVHFDFMEPPSPESMMRALEMLYFLGAIDDESDLTDIGRLMADFPIDPHLGRTMISAAHRGCCEEMLAIIAMLSIPPPFWRARHAVKAADRAHRTFSSGMGDHLSLLTTYAQYDQSDAKSQFCKKFFLHERAMKQAVSVNRQLRGVAARLKIVKKPAAGAELVKDIRKALVDGFFMQCAYIDQGGKNYMTVSENQLVNISPGSFLQHKPEWVLYHETTVTDRCYMRWVTAIPPEMLIEVAPKFYHPDKCKLPEHAKKSLQRALPRLKR